MEDVLYAGIQSTVFVEDKPIDKLRFSRDEDGCLFYNSDVKLLLNAERLKSFIGEEGYLSIIRSITPPAKKPIHDQLSDADLIRTVKSRFIQAPSEVQAWFNQMELEYQDLVDEIKSQQVDQSSSVEQKAEGNVESNS